MHCSPENVYSPKSVLSFSFFSFLGPHLQHMEVPRLGVKSELQVSAYTTATATSDLSCICDLHYSSRQCRSPTHWARPGIEPASSWILVRFVSAAPPWELGVYILNSLSSGRQCINVNKKLFENSISHCIREYLWFSSEISILANTVVWDSVTR